MMKQSKILLSQRECLAQDADKTIPKLSELNIIQRNNLFSVLRVEITHHSNKIEGVTLDYGETKKLLEDGITAFNKPLSDHLITLGFANAYDEILRSSYSNNQLTSDYIKDIHTLIFDEALKICPNKVDRPVGAYRKDERYITGVDFEISNPILISNHIENLLFQKTPISIEEIAKFHIDFEKIHPFADGNGRVGRLLMTRQFIQNDLIPPLIKNDFRKEYIKAMNNIKELYNFLKLAQIESYKIIDKNLSLDQKLKKISDFQPKKAKTNDKDIER